MEGSLLKRVINEFSHDLKLLYLSSLSTKPFFKAYEFDFGHFFTNVCYIPRFRIEFLSNSDISAPKIELLF